MPIALLFLEPIVAYVLKWIGSLPGQAGQSAHEVVDFFLYFLPFGDLLLVCIVRAPLPLSLQRLLQHSSGPFTGLSVNEPYTVQSALRLEIPKK